MINMNLCHTKLSKKLPMFVVVIFLGIYLTISTYADVDPTCIFSRDSMRYDSIGNLISYNCPWYTDSAPGFGKGIMVEEGTTNILTYESQFENTAWVKGASSIIQNATTAPDGSNTAYKLKEDNSNAIHSISHTASIVSANYTLSIFAKAAERNWLVISFGNLTNGIAWVNLASGQFGTVQSAIKKYEIKNIGNGWYRIGISANIVAGTFANVGTAIDDLQNSYLGDGNSGVYIWRAGLEKKSYMTSWTPNGTPRSPESLTIPMTGMSPTQGTWEQMVYITDMAKRQVTNQYNTILFIPRANSSSAAIWLYHEPKAAKWNINNNDDNNINEWHEINDSVTPSNQWFLFRVAWSSNQFTLTIFNLFGIKVWETSWSNPILPSGFAATAQMGCSMPGFDYLNTYHDEIRLSNIVRTDSPDLSRPLPVDQFTVFKANFDMNLSRTGTPPSPDHVTVQERNSEVDLSWNVVSTTPNVTSYNIKRALNSGGPYMTIANVVTNQYTDGNVTNGITYYYIITSINANGESNPSAEVFATPQMPLANPPKITIMPSSNFITITWTPVAGAEGYDIEVDGTLIDNGVNISYVNNDLATDSQHTYRVRSRNSTGVSDWTTAVGTTINSTTTPVPTSTPIPTSSPTPVPTPTPDIQIILDLITVHAQVAYPGDIQSIAVLIDGQEKVVAPNIKELNFTLDTYMLQNGIHMLTVRVRLNDGGEVLKDKIVNINNPLYRIRVEVS